MVFDDGYSLTGLIDVSMLPVMYKTQAFHRVPRRSIHCLSSFDKVRNKVILLDIYWLCLIIAYNAKAFCKIPNGSSGKVIDQKIRHLQCKKYEMKIWDLFILNIY